MPLQTVDQPQRLYRQIADQVRALITQGEFAPAARLPAERDLARQLGVSRPSVREALIALEVEGWVEVRTGSGVYVKDRPRNGDASHAPVPPTEWGPLELIRARKVIEGEVAVLAAANAKRRDIEAITRAIAAMQADADRGTMPLEGDRAFHVAIATAAGNAVLLETVQAFWDARRGPIFERLGGHFETVASWRKAIAEHTAVLHAIEQHDPQAARAAMHSHMDKAHARFSASWRRTRSS